MFSWVKLKGVLYFSELPSVLKFMLSSKEFAIWRHWRFKQLAVSCSCVQVSTDSQTVLSGPSLPGPLEMRECVWEGGPDPTSWNLATNWQKAVWRKQHYKPPSSSVHSTLCCTTRRDGLPPSILLIKLR